MSRTLTETQVFAMFKDAIANIGSQRRFAILTEQSCSYICDQIKQTRPMSEATLSFLGVEKITTYRECVE